MSTDIKLSKAQTSRIIRSRIFLFFVLGNLGKLLLLQILLFLQLKAIYMD